MDLKFFRLPYFGFVLFSESDSEDNLEKSVNNNDDDNGEFIHLYYMKNFYGYRTKGLKNQMKN